MTGLEAVAAEVAFDREKDLRPAAESVRKRDGLGAARIRWTG